MAYIPYWLKEKVFLKYRTKDDSRIDTYYTKRINNEIVMIWSKEKSIIYPERDVYYGLLWINPKIGLKQNEIIHLWALQIFDTQFEYLGEEERAIGGGWKFHCQKFKSLVNNTLRYYDRNTGILIENEYNIFYSTNLPDIISVRETKSNYDKRIKYEDDHSIKIEIGGDAIFQRTNIGGQDSFSICPYCGKKIDLPKTPKFCPYCGELLMI